jgi:nucleoside-diphosphate-sugar epimerase
MVVGLIGGAGFVGSRLATVMGKSRTEYRVFDKVLTGEDYLDITKPETFNKLPNLDVVVNLAAEHRDDVSPRSLYDLVNVEGSRNVCDFCRAREVKTIIFTSSVAVYGFAPEGTDESGEINYFNDYGRTKFEAEEVYREWFEEDPDNRNLVIVRPTVIFGEGNRGNVYNLLKQIASGRFVMFGSGNNKKSMAYVVNVTEFLFYAVGLKGYNIFNYIDKPDISMNALVSSVRRTLHKTDGVGLRFPAWVGTLAGYSFDLVAFCLRKKLPISSVRVKKFMGTTSFETSIDKSGFSPRISLEEGLLITLKYEFIEDNSGARTFITE